MIVLGFESAASGCAACVLQDGRVLASVQETMERGQDARLVPLIQEAVKQAGLELSAIDRLAVSRGPGSFTGVRIGLATGLGLALALETPLLAFDRFALFRHAFPDALKLFVILESKRLELFCEREAGQPSMLAPEEIEAALQAEPAAQITGDATAFFEEKGIAPLLLPRPEAEIAALLAQKTDPADPAFAPHPLYLRPPDVTMPREAS